ncbi:MAG: hypothetical protein IK093_00875 [Ruminiclostridium sp.]|nr:hypothetical protein [Ruminiclostridium sp.]
MNGAIAKTGAMIVTVTVFLFAVFLITGFTFGSYFVCLILPIGFIMMTVGFYHERTAHNSAAALLGVIFAAVYSVLIMQVYFAQLTAVRLDDLNEQAMQILDYSRGGLLFSYDLLGYGIMALSTFFTGLSLKKRDKADKLLKILMLIHGVFFISCLIMPMTGLFKGMADGDTSSGGVAALVFWCIYFLPIGILSFRHFCKKTQ